MAMVAPAPKRSLMISSLKFPPYVPQDNAVFFEEEEVTTDTTLARERILTVMVESFGELLEASHEVFWSHVLHDEDLHACITTYLRFRRRPFDPFVNAAVSPLYDKEVDVNLATNILLVLIRMSRVREDKLHGFEPEAWANLVYDYFVFDVPRLMDIASVFSPHNTSLVRAIMMSVYEHQPQYWSDTETAFTAIASCLVQVHSPTRTTQAEAGRVVGVGRVEDAIMFAWDIVASLNSFVETLPESWFICKESKLLTALAYTYESVVPALHDWLNTQAKTEGGNPSMSSSLRGQNAEIVEATLSRVLVQMSSLIIRTVGLAIAHGLVSPLLLSFETSVGRHPCFEHKDPKSRRNIRCPWGTEHIEGKDAPPPTFATPNARFDALFQLLESLAHADAKDILNTRINESSARLPAGSFVRHMNKVFRFDRAIRKLADQEQLVDHTCADYIEQLIGCTSSRSVAGTPFSPPMDAPPSRMLQHTPLSLDQPTTSAPSQKQQQPALSEEAQMVKSIFPELGEGFVELLLESFNNNTDAAVGALVENNLPEGLRQVDRKLPRKTKTQPKPSNQPTTPQQSSEELSWLTRVIERVHAIRQSNRSEGEISDDDSAGEGADRTLGLGAVPRDVAVRALEAQYEDEWDDSYEGIVRPDDPTLEDLDQDDLMRPNPNRPTLADLEANGDDDEDDDGNQAGPSTTNKATPGGPQTKHQPPVTDQDRRHKQHNKHRIANHRRRDKAMRKMTRGLGLA